MRLLMFWRNPEFIRHRRSELRKGRAITILVVVVVICVLVWLGNWGSEQRQIAANHYRAQQFQLSSEKLVQLDAQAPIDLWRDFCQMLIFGQVAVLTFWSLLCCAQSISRERERKTWDFQRATSLTPVDFLIGKLLGEPIAAWLIVFACLPITIIAAWRGHQGIATIVAGYALIIFSSFFIGLVGLWLSNLFETRSRGIGLLSTFGLYLLLAAASKWGDYPLPGLAAFSPIMEMDTLFGPTEISRRAATIFGTQVSWLAMSLLLYFTFGAWFVLMILRSLKKDFDQIKPLSRWQAVGCAAFLNFTIYALFQPKLTYIEGIPEAQFTADMFVTFMVAINAAILFAMGLAMISPYDRLKIWWRERHGLESLLAEDSPPLPWLVVSATTAYILLMWGMFAGKTM